ncbi:MAG: hypothetical protein ACI91B_004088, partial [Planctomycetota bacterium]
MKRRRQRHDRHIARRRANAGNTKRPNAKTVAEVRQEQLAQSTIKLAELAKDQPCLICGGSSDKVAISIAEPGSALRGAVSAADRRPYRTIIGSGEPDVTAVREARSNFWIRRARRYGRVSEEAGPHGGATRWAAGSHRRHRRWQRHFLIGNDPAGSRVRTCAPRPLASSSSIKA